MFGHLLFCFVATTLAFWSPLDIEDPIFQGSQQVAAADLKWVDALSLGVHGRAFPKDSETPYDRLPKEAHGVVREPVWSLSRCTAGFYVPFTTNSAVVAVNYTLRYNALNMYHFPTTGVSGIDLYALDETTHQWRWVAIATSIKYPVTTATLFHGRQNVQTKYLLFLPTYNGILDFHIGVGRSDSIQPFNFNTAKPIVWYGTSILQGGVASRPGVAFTNNLTMELGRDIFNFGFSGNGLMEKEVMQYLLRLDPAAYIIDCNPNMTPQQISERAVPLIMSIIAKHPKTPIILAEQPTYGDNWFLSGFNATQHQKKVELKRAYDILIAGGAKTLHYVTGDLIYGRDDGINPTVDGTHPTDIGMYRYAEFYKTYLKSLGLK